VRNVLLFGIGDRKIMKTKQMKIERKENKKAMTSQRDGLNQFAAAMLKKLELRNERKIETGTLADPIRSQQGPLLGQWKEHDIWYYFRRMKGETGELQGALKRHEIRLSKETCLAVISECCDVANFCAAIAEKAVEETI